MFRKNLKFHAIALGTICTIITVLFLLIGPKKNDVDPNANPMAIGDRYVRVFTATWGMECNTQIEQLKTKPLVKNADGSMPSPYENVTRDNVLPQLSELCNGHLKCTVSAVPEVLGSIHANLSCYKKLEIGYRCFSYDRMWMAEVNQGTQLNLDCSEEADKDRK